MQVLPPKVAQVEKDMLRMVVSAGTGKAAQVGTEDIWGKTGTTENYGDAWFVGGNDDLTVAIWVGYADKTPADGVRARRQPGRRRHLPGRDLPRLHDVLARAAAGPPARARGEPQPEDGTSTDVAPAVPVSPTEVPPATTAPADARHGRHGDGRTGGGGGGGGGGGQTQAPPQNQQPAQPPPTPAQPETPPPTGGGGGGVSPGGGTPLGGSRRIAAGHGRDT